jgi:hypothetical protein
MFADFIDAVDTEAREVRFRIHDDGYTPGAAQGTAAPEPFDIAFDGGDFTLSNCVYRRGPVTKEIAAITGAVVGDGTQYIAVWIDSSVGTGAAYVGTTIASVTDAAVNAESTKYKVLLYKVNRVTEGGVVTVSVLVDYRKGAGVFLYV